MKEAQKSQRNINALRHPITVATFREKEIHFDENSPALLKKKAEAEAFLKSNRPLKK